MMVKHLFKKNTVINKIKLYKFFLQPITFSIREKGTINVICASPLEKTFSFDFFQHK